MNFHLIFVHFPIALFTIYSLLELVRLKRILAWPAWQPIKSAFLLFGFLGGLAAYLAGEAIEEEYAGPGKIGRMVELHSNLALATMIFSGIILVLHAALWAQKTGLVERIASAPLRRMMTFFVGASRIVLETHAAILVGLVGLALVTLTGGLGGAIANGQGVDPIADWIVKTFIE